MKQYTYTFNNGVARYTIVASSYAQAKRHVSKMLTKWLVVVYNGRYIGAPVANGKCISVVGI